MSNFTIIGSPDKYVLFLSPLNYFGVDGYKIYAKTLQEVIDIIETEKYDNMYIRLQCDRPKKNPDYWRVLILPWNGKFREIEACTFPKTTDKVFGIKRREDKNGNTK